MTRAERAKQFMPYAALKGFDEYIKAMERETVERVILGEDAAQELNRRLQSVGIGDIIRVTYYLNQQYVDIEGAVKKIDMFERNLLIGSTKVPLEDILAVEWGAGL